MACMGAVSPPPAGPVGTQPASGKASAAQPIKRNEMLPICMEILLPGRPRTATPLRS